MELQVKEAMLAADKAFPGCTLGVMISSESITHPESNNMCLMNKTA